MLKSNADRAFLAILLNVLLWSFFPALSHLSNGVDDLWAIVFYSQFFGAISCLFFLRFRTLDFVAKRIISNAIPLFITMSFSSVLLLVFFATANQYLESPTATVILEFWPISALVLAMFFLKQKMSGPTKITIFAVLFSVFGLVMSLIPEFSFEGVDLKSSLTGSAMAIAAAIVSGATILQSELARRAHRARSFAVSASVTFLLRCFAIPPTFLLAMYFDANLFDFDALLIGSAFGVTGYGLASMLAIYGMRFADRLDYILLWFASPVLGLIWLAAIFSQVISLHALVGFIVIFSANALLNFGEIRRKSIVFSQIVGCFIITSIIFLPSLPAEEYYNALFILTTFFIVFSSFLLQKQSEIFIVEMSSLLTDDTKRLNSSQFENENVNTLRRISTFTAEKIVLVTIGGATIFCSIVFRSGKILDDFVALSLSLVVTFLIFHCFEAVSPKHRDQLIFDAISKSQSEFDQDYRRRLITAVSFILVYLLCCTTILAKHTQ